MGHIVWKPIKEELGFGDIVLKPVVCGISVGKEHYGLFKRKTRYYITVDNVTRFYYSEYTFWLNFFETCEEYELTSLEESILGMSV